MSSALLIPQPDKFSGILLTHDLELSEQTNTPHMEIHPSSGGEKTIMSPIDTHHTTQEASCRLVNGGTGSRHMAAHLAAKSNTTKAHPRRIELENLDCYGGSSHVSSQPVNRFFFAVNRAFPDEPRVSCGRHPAQLTPASYPSNSDARNNNCANATRLCLPYLKYHQTQPSWRSRSYPRVPRVPSNARSV